MSWTKKSGSLRSSSFSLAVFTFLTLCLSGFAIGQTTFPGTGTGALPDNDPTGLTVTFTVSGLSGSPSAVSMDMTADHTWVGDLTGTLTAPDGSTSAVVLSNTGGPGFGDSSNLGGTYNFVNGGGDWLGAAGGGGTDFVIPPGDYSASTDTGTTTVDLNAAFAGLADPNGDWTFLITDGAVGDTGNVTAANLTLTAGGVAPGGTTWNDYDGDGTTDYSVARDMSTALTGGTRYPRTRAERVARLTKKPSSTDNLGVGGSPGTDIAWYNHLSGDSSFASFNHGMPTTDFITPNDFDGDGQTDIAVWRQAGAGSAAFYILDSSTSTVRVELFGQPGDNSAVTADYDGDGAADVAVFRCPAVAGQCNFFYRGTAGGGETTFVPWGNGTAFTLFPNTGDFDGDGRADFNVQGTDPNNAGQGLFSLLRSSDFGVEFVSWGLNTDLIIPGDYDGDGRNDYAIGRNIGGQRSWSVLSADASTVIYFDVPFGLGSDTLIPGDYDGDGATDIAVFRDAGDDDMIFHYSLDSSTLAFRSFEWGAANDFPTANSQVQ